MASFIDRLFPAEELEALGNKWPAPSPVNKKRKLDTHHEQCQPRKQNNTPSFEQRRHTVSLPSKQSAKTLLAKPTGTSTIKRSNSASLATTPSKPSTSNTTRKSCLPDFIEPSLLRNYLHHLHPNDRTRYSIPNSPEAESKPILPKSSPTIATQQIDAEESACSPASMTTDTSSSSEPESCPTPSAGIFEQFRTGPFGHLFNGMRITEHERDFMEDLLGPMNVLSSVPNPEIASKPTNRTKSALFIEPEVVSTDRYGNEGPSLRQIFAEDEKPVTYRGFSIGDYKYEDDDDEDVHSSGMSPVNVDEQDDEIEEPNYYTTRNMAISVDDFFDLEEASELA